MRKFSSLSRELENKNSPIYSYVRDNFPNTVALARLYKKQAAELLVPTITPIESSRSSIVGDAFDLVARFMANTKYYPEQALSPIIGHNLLEHGEDAAYALDEIGLNPNQELTPTAAAICWFLALTTQAYRTGGIIMDSPLSPFIDDCEPEEILALASAEDIEELQRLHKIAQKALYPLFTDLDKDSIILGPEFSGSEFCKADADIIASGTLIEIKTRIGRKDKNAVYADTLRPEDTRAVLGYILFDLEDEYQLKEVVFYSARYGTVFQISVAEFLEVLSGQPVNLAEARADMRRILEH